MLLTGFQKVEGLSRAVASSVQDLEQSARQLEQATQQTVERLLCEDDRLLASLQKLSRELDPIDEKDDGAVEALRTVCSRYIYIYVFD